MKFYSKLKRLLPSQGPRKIKGVILSRNVFPTTLSVASVFLFLVRLKLICSSTLSTTAILRTVI